MTEFEKAAKDLPAEVRYDPIDQKTVEDLVFAAELELDIVEGNEIHYRDMDGRTKRGVKIRLRNFIEKYKDNSA